MRAPTIVAGRRRQSLDQLVRRLAEPGFVSLHRRLPKLRQTRGHVDLTILSMESPRSRYVRRFRRHARRCAECAAAFKYLGLPI